MHYKTIVLELIEQHPILHNRLRASRTLLEAVNRHATALKACHESWKNRLAEARPGSEASQIANEALELALQELQADLQQASSPSETETEPLSLDAAMAFIRRHTSPAS